MTEPITIKIEKLVHEGKGLGRFNNKPVFVPFVLPGETVVVEIERRHSQYSQARLVKILEPSPERTEPPCPYFAKCGGCQWQHMTYEAQLEWKQKILAETLQRTGKIEDAKVLPTIPAPKNFGWRSRVTFHGNEQGQIGFFAAETHKVVDIEKCLIVEDEINQKLGELKKEKRQNIKKDYEVNTSGKEGFTQVNPLQNENLKKLLKEWAMKLPHDTIVELFAGSGNFTEVLIPMAKSIIAVESDRNAVALARKWLNERPLDVRSSMSAERFICTDAVKYFAQYKLPLDLLVLDPPRDGAAGIVEGVMKSRPKNILYISCNPATLARDLKYLKDFAGYHFVQSQPIDMFPMSYHIESITHITSP